jgi:hypothetical protein
MQHHCLTCVPDHPWCGRSNNNPSQLVVAAKIAALHGAEAAAVTCSGMAAITTTLGALLAAGDHILVQVWWRVGLRRYRSADVARMEKDEGG